MGYGPSAVDPNEVEDFLRELKNHYRDYAWLEERHEKISAAIRFGLYKGNLILLAVDGLCGVVPYMFTRDDYDRWMKLLLDALPYVPNISTEALLQEVYNYMGQGYVLNDEINSARVFFKYAISYDILNEEMAERALLAYIGLFRTETYQPSEDFTPAMVEQALELRRRLQPDAFLTALLYQSLSAAYTHRLDLTQALTYGFTALGYWYSRQNTAEISKTTLYLAVAYRAAGMKTHARRLLDITHKYIAQLDIQNSIGRRYAALAAYEMGCLDFVDGAYDRAAEQLAKAYTEFFALGWQHPIAMTNEILGQTLGLLGRFEEAEARLNDALDGWNMLQKPFGQASVLYLTASLARRQMQPQAARSWLMQALTTSTTLPDTDATKQLRSTILEALTDLDDSGPSAPGSEL